MPDRMRQGRTPDTICLLAALAIGGGVLSLAGYIPRSVEAITPAWGGMVWGAVLAVSAALALVGVLWRDPVIGWALEVAGRPGVALTCIGYAGAIAQNMDGGNFGAALAVALFGSFGLASIWRAYQLMHNLAAFRVAMGILDGWRRR